MAAQPGVGVRLAEIVGLLALGQDNAFGQPQGSQLRSALIAQALADALGVPIDTRMDIYWVSLLRYIGCTGHAHEVAVIFGDDIATRDRSVTEDLSDPRDLLPELLRHAGEGRSTAGRLRTLLAMLAGGRRFVEMNFRTGCEVGDALLERLGMPDSVRSALADTFEQWNGRGFPRGRRGAEIPLAMRLVRLAHDAEALTRIRGIDEAASVLRRRSGTVYDPELVAALLEILDATVARLDVVDPWDEVMLLESEPHHRLDEGSLDRALLAMADFVDLKSPYLTGHSRGVADLAARAGERLGLSAGDVCLLRRAGWVHDLGRTAIPNSIWDRTEPLTRSDVDRIQMHPLLTEQMLRRCDGLAGETALAAHHHERLDGSGYAKGLTAAQLSLSARILAAADRYQDLVEERAYRSALSPAHAARALEARVADGRLDHEAVLAVLEAAGHPERRDVSPRPTLTEREIQVIQLAVRGLTVGQVGTRLGISPKTVDTHIQHVYSKTGVSTRGALALYAVERGLLGPEPAPRRPGA